MDQPLGREIKLIMNKAFIFDMDGVLIDTEREWETNDDGGSAKVLGKDIHSKLGDLIGVAINETYKRAVALGYSVDYEEYRRRYDKEAAGIFSRAQITEGVEDLIKELLARNFKLGLVSSSPKNWINFLLSRLSFSNKLEQIVSLNDRDDLKPKPSPDGYLEALKSLKADAKKSFILEDSNLGIQAAKASGAYVIAFRGNLVQGYVQKGADAYVEKMADIIKLIETIQERT